MGIARSQEPLWRTRFWFWSLPCHFRSPERDVGVLLAGIRNVRHIKVCQAASSSKRQAPNCWVPELISAVNTFLWVHRRRRSERMLGKALTLRSGKQEPGGRIHSPLAAQHQRSELFPFDLRKILYRFCSALGGFAFTCRCLARVKWELRLVYIPCEWSSFSFLALLFSSDPPWKNTF